MDLLNKSLRPDFSFENRYWIEHKIVAGVDEAGRGPLAGPVVAASVIFRTDRYVYVPRDSKKLTSNQRDDYFLQIIDSAISVGIGMVGPEEIDSINILQASLKCMAEAVNNLTLKPELVIVDGNQQLPLNIQQLTLVKGDTRSISVAAASVIAKVTRDKLMYVYGNLYPAYNFKQHKGYPTKEHLSLIKEFGSCPIHRKTFKGVNYNN